MFDLGKVAIAAGVMFVAATSCLAQAPSFPGALGFGSYATGGRNGTVYHVTTLADSGAGSFREAVSSANRVIVFDVGGTINLITAVSARGNLTIAGQTAPGGIKFDAGEISFAGRSNIVCRFIRIRPGSNTASTGDDCLSLYNARNAIFDHVSMEFGPWNNLDAVSANWQTTPVTDITFQHCLDANPIGQQFGAHTESPSSDWTWCYNIFANSHNRNPLSKVNDVFINNLEYNNSAGYTTHTSTSFKHDIVNNYFVAGPGSSGGTSYPWFQVDNNQSIYCSGNYLDANRNGTLDGSLTNIYWYQGGGGGTVLSTPWSSWTSIIPTMSTALAWRYGVSAAGAFPRDEVDALVISQLKTLASGTTGTGAGTVGPDGGLYTSQTQTGLGNNGYGTITGLNAPADTDNDGMPDYWELATGSNPNVANPLTNTVTGYTLLENYLNFLAAPHAVTRSNTPVTINLRQFTDGFAASATFSLTNATNGTVALLNGTNAVFTPTANFTSLGAFTFTVTEGSYALSAIVTVCVTPILPPSSATAFNGVFIAAAASVAVVTPPANLVWRGDGSGNAWNTTASNWLNDSALAKYKDNDVVTFDNTGSNTPSISIATTLIPGAMLFDIDKNYTLVGNGSFSGSGSFSKTGTGTLLIATTNSGYTGSINVSGGTLALSNGASMGSGVLTLNSGTTVSLPPSGGAAFISGPVNIPAGQSATIATAATGNGVNGNVSSGDNTSVLNLSGSVGFTGTSSSQFNGFTGTINIPSGSTLRFSAGSGNNTFGSLNPNFIINGTLQPRNSTNTIIVGALNGSGQLTGPQTAGTGTGNTVYNIGGKNQDTIFNGTIISNANSAGSAICVNKVGSGSQLLNGNNTYTGTNSVQSGALFLNGTNMPSLCTVFSAATLGGTGIITGPVSVNSGGILSPGTSGRGAAGTLRLGSHLTNNSPMFYFDLSGSPAGANDRVNMAGTLAMSGVQTFNFNLADNALGAGTYYLIDGANNSTASGVTFAHNLPAPMRQFLLLTNSAVGVNPSDVHLTVAGTAASLVWRGTNGVNWDTATTNWDNGSTPDIYYNLDTVTFDDTGSNPASVTLVATLTPAAITVNSSQNYIFGGSGALAGSAPLTKLGSGTLAIGTSNGAYAGPLKLYGGTLAATAAGALGSGALTISNGATLTLPASGSVSFGGSVTIPANTTGTISSSSVSNSLSGNLYSGNSSSVLNLSSGVSFGGTNSAQFDSFTGTINIPSGATLRYSANSSGNIFGSPNPVLVIIGTLQPRNAGNTVVLGAFTGSGTLAGPQANSGTGDTLFILGGNNTSAAFSGIISSNSTVSGSEVAVTKTGTGTLTLSGTSTYTGGTTVEGGTLRINNTSGSGTGSGSLEVFSAAMLTGSGSIGGAATIDNGAILAPGNPSGALTFMSHLTLNDGSLLSFVLGTNSDSVVVNGDLFLTGQLSVTNGGGFGVAAYTLFTCGGSLNFDNLQLVAAPSGYNYSFNTNTSGVVKLVVAPTTPPVIGSLNVTSKTNLVMSGSNGVPLGNYYVLTATNLTLPPASWTRASTNQFDSVGNFGSTNAMNLNSPQTFYRLQVP